MNREGTKNNLKVKRKRICNRNVRIRSNKTNNNWFKNKTEGESINKVKKQIAVNKVQNIFRQRANLKLLKIRLSKKMY